MSYAYAHIFGLQTLVFDKILEFVFLVEVKRVGAVLGIHDEEAAPRAIVGAEEHLLGSQGSPWKRTRQGRHRRTRKACIVQVAWTKPEPLHIL